MSLGAPRDISRAAPSRRLQGRERGGGVRGRARLRRVVCVAFRW
jgi:hypothetical protein